MTGGEKDVAPAPVTAGAIEARYRILDRIGCLGSSREDGYLRAAYSDEETRVMEYIAESALAAGLRCRYDGLGNLAVETPGAFGEWVETGSHVDTVPFGGNYDGLAGVVAGLEAIIAISRSPFTCRKGLRLRVWRGEESAAYNAASTGSRGAFGMADPALLSNRFRGLSLEEAMIGQGCDPSLIKEGKATISVSEVDSIAAYVELHIEQGSLLEKEGREIGIVTGIRGPARIMVTLEGEFDHSGATPMGARYRRDVNLAMGHIIVKLDKLAEHYINDGMDLVQTIGVINSSRDMNDAHPSIYQNALTKVSGYGYFSHEIRSCNVDESDHFINEAKKIICNTAAGLGVNAKIEELSRTPGLPSLDEGIRAGLEDACREAGASFMEMASGAWHDAAVVAGQKRSDGSTVPAGMIFIPCRGGKSHSPAEYSSAGQIARGATVLAGAMLRLAGS